MEQGREQDPEMADGAEERSDEDASQEVMSLLSQHVPLALLADLALPDGPESPEILDEEGLPEVAWWEAGEERDEAEGSPEGAAPSV